LEWIKADKRHLALFHEAVEGAWSTFEQDRVEALKRILADGFSNSARRIDIDTLVVKALQYLDPPHVQVLATMASWGRGGMGYGSVDDLTWSLPQLSGAMDPILSVLQRHGCAHNTQVVEQHRGTRSFDLVTETWRITTFGRECLKFLTGAVDLEDV
jgi:hypothetical protein